MKAISIAFFFICYCMEAFAQSDYKGGVMFQLKPDFSFEKDWKLNTKLESRQLLFEGLNKDPFNSVFRYDRTDLEMVLSKKASASTSLGGGYLIRLENKSFIHRFIQQLSIAQNALGLRLGHRFRTDQTFEKENSPRYRLRYRLSAEKALNGQSVDPGELYLVANNEYLQTIQDKKYSLEIRVLAALGFNFSDKNKLEAGLDYRIEKLFLESTTQLTWFNIAWYISL